MMRRFIGFSVLMIGLVLLGGCGGGGGESYEVQATTTGPFEGMPESVPAGDTTFVLQNEDDVQPHDLRFEGVDQGTAEVPSGGSEEVTVSLEPGTYTYFCSIPGHREAGMEGSLTVE